MSAIKITLLIVQMRLQIVSFFMSDYGNLECIETRNVLFQKSKDVCTV